MQFDLWKSVAGLALGALGAGVITLYTFVNRGARKRGPRATWGFGALLGTLGMTCLGAGWILLCLAEPRIFGWGIRWSGLPLILASGIIYAVSARWVGRLRGPARYSVGLHTAGIYRHVRHPQALSLCLLSVGAGLLSGSLPYLVTVPLWIAFWVAYTHLEERVELIPTFGDAYLLYRRETPRLLPRIGRKR